MILDHLSRVEGRIMTLDSAERRTHYVCGFALFSGRLPVVYCTSLPQISYKSVHVIVGGSYPEACQDITSHIVKWRTVRAITFVHEA